MKIIDLFNLGIPLVSILGIYAVKGIKYPGFRKVNDGLIINLPTGKIKIQICTEKIIRIIYVPTEKLPANSSLIAKTNWKKIKWTFTKNDNTIQISTFELSVNYDCRTSSLTFNDKDNNIILKESPGQARDIHPVTIMNEKTYNVSQKFSITEDEGIYGLGQYQNGVMNYRDHDVLLVQANMEVVVPFMVSTKNYGILWDNYSKTKFHDGKDGMTFWSEVADAIDYYFVFGKNIDEVISGYRVITGQAPLYGKWAYGYWQSKEHYKTRDELINTVKEYRERKIPIDNIVQDWEYWGDNDHWNSMKFIKNTYPRPKEMIDILHKKYNVHIMISIWPSFGKKTLVYKEMKKKGYLFDSQTWAGGKVYDAFNPKARKIYWEYMKKGLFSKGIDAWWMDATEPEFLACDTQEQQEALAKAAGNNYLGSFARYLNPYSLLTTKNVYENQRRINSKKRVYILTRSAFAGQQKYAATTWSGDIPSNWEVFRKQISAGLNFCMAGIPYWATDIGAFFPGSRGGLYPNGVNDPRYRELYVRWYEYGTFCPIFRSHGTGTPREIWQFGEPGSWAYDALVKYDILRYRLMPYIYSLAWKITQEGYTIMRGLPFDFAHDKKVHKIDNQFMFGPAILVKPVTEEMYQITLPFNQKSESKKPKINKENQVKSTDVYLPEDAGWCDFWTGEKYIGGIITSKNTPIDIIPLFIKAGSIIPLGPELQYSTEKPADPIELRIYPGANGEFILYEDENDNYNYEKGVYATIQFKWNDNDKVLYIGKRLGKFPGMLKERTFNIVIVGSSHGIGIDYCSDPDKIIKYSSEIVNVTLK